MGAELLHGAGHIMGAILAGIDPQAVATGGNACRQPSTADPIDDILIRLMGSAAELAVCGSCETARRSADRDQAVADLISIGIPVEGNLECLERRALQIANYSKKFLERVASGEPRNESPAAIPESMLTEIAQFHPDLDDLAYHESGHIVLANHYRFDIEEVELKFCLQSDGHVSYALEFDVQAIGTTPSVRVMKEAFREMTVCYAGVVAVENLHGISHTHDACVRDIIEAAEVALALEAAWGRASLYDALRPRVVRRAVDLTRVHWTSIQTLARELLRSGHLHQEDIRGILKSTGMENETNPPGVL